MTEESTRHERELVTEEAEPKLKRPPLYQVVLLNDDYTPMEFVVDVLERIFGMDRTTATRVMLEVHTKGKGVCGVFTFEIAETKVAQVTTYARQHQPRNRRRQVSEPPTQEAVHPLFMVRVSPC